MANLGTFISHEEIKEHDKNAGVFVANSSHDPSNVYLMIYKEIPEYGCKKPDIIIKLTDLQGFILSSFVQDSANDARRAANKAIADKMAKTFDTSKMTPNNEP